MTGEGIGQALATGRWAAESVLGHPGDPAGARAAYEHEVHRDLAVDHRFAELLGRRPDAARSGPGRVRVAGLNDWTRRNFARWLFEDYPRALLRDPRSLAPGDVHRPGRLPLRSCAHD